MNVAEILRRRAVAHPHRIAFLDAAGGDWTNANNEVKAGLNIKRYPIREKFSFGITDPGLNDPSVPDAYNPSLAPYDLTRGRVSYRYR